MTVAGAMALDRERRSAGDEWWRDAALMAAEPLQSGTPDNCGTYLIGRGLLQVETADQEARDAIDRYYGECATNPGAGIPGVHCALRSVDHGRLVRLDFLSGAPADPAASALALLPPSPGEPPYAIERGEMPAWRLVGGRARPLIAATGNCIIAERSRIPEDFVADYLISAALEAQREILVVHAAALSAGGRGVLLTGASRTGKTTFSMHLAARGHRLLGDEMGLIHLPTRYLVPLRRAVRLRAGPREPSLAAALRRAGVVERVAAGSRTGPVRIDRLFPAADAVAAPLAAVFFLRGFAAVPSLEPFQPTLDDGDLFEAMSANDIALISLGLAPARHALRLLALRRTLAHLPCWRLTLGSPDATARLVERTLEAL